MDTTQEYIIGRGHATFNSYNEAAKIIIALIEQKKYMLDDYKYYAKYDEISKKWYIEWFHTNPNYVKPKIFEIEI